MNSWSYEITVGERGRGIITGVGERVCAGTDNWASAQFTFQLKQVKQIFPSRYNLIRNYLQAGWKKEHFNPSAFNFFQSSRMSQIFQSLNITFLSYMWAPSLEIFQAR